MTAPARSTDRPPPLTELEAVVLGLIRDQSPCTAYAVRLTVRRSLSTQWSGSAGAVYPAVRRLEERGYIQARPSTTGRRASTQLALTRAGNRALARWLVSPADLGAAPADPLRTRLRFLDALPPPRQRAFVNRARSQLLAGLREIESDVEREQTSGASRFRLAMARGALHAARARLKMLDELLRDLGGS